jgi:hypothetical protein
MDVELLQKALDNETNQDLMQLTTKKIEETKRYMVSQLHFSAKETNKILRQLREYRYVENMDEIKEGFFVRWFDLSDPENLSLQRVAIVCEIQVADEGVYIVLRNFGNAYFTIQLDKSLVFQKLSSQEKVILAALDYTAND